MGRLDYLRDRNDQRVVEALGRACTICKAQPGEDCRNPWDGKPLNRVVHQCRAEHHIDQRSRA